MNLLGYNISYGEIKPDQNRLQALLDLSPPTNANELKRVVGLFAYYARWIENFSKKAAPLMNCKTCPLTDEGFKSFIQLKKDLANASLGTIRDDLPFEVETDASDHAIAGILSQNGRPVAYFSRQLNAAERNYPAVEKEATACVEAIRKWSCFLRGKHFSLYTDQRSVSFMFDRRSRSKIKNNKILCWRIELSQYSYDIKHKPGNSNVAPDALSRIICSTIPFKNRLLALHNSLGHPGFARMYHFVKCRNLPFTSEETKEVCCQSQTCAEIKPRFFKPPQGQLIKATQTFERISMDFKGLLKGKNPYMLVIIDEFSRFPFAFSCRNISTKTVMCCLDKLFCVFGFPSYVHSDRGSSFMSHELKSYLRARGTASSRSTPYHPCSNGQCERCVQTVWCTVKLKLHERSLSEERWEDVLPESLHAIRSLVCLATNETPHDRMFKFNRRSMTGVSMPAWLLKEGPVYLRKFIRNKSDPLCERVYLLDANPSHAHVRLSNGNETTVSTSDLAPVPENGILKMKTIH